MLEHLQVQAMSEYDAQQICLWQYDEPYHMYQWSSWDEVYSQQIEFGDTFIREQQYRSLTSHNELIGFIQLFPLSQTVRLAIFLAPHHCDKGYGVKATELAVAEAMRLYAGYDIDLEVECWNKRAIRSYEKAHFSISDQYELPHQGSIKQVYCMIYVGLL